MSFYTGGGDNKKASLALTHSSDTWGVCEQHLLDNCPDVRSSGLLVESLQRPRIHWPGQLPYYIRDISQAQVVCTEDNKIYADRVEENVPIFKDIITLTPDVAAATAAAAAEPEPGEAQEPQGDDPVAPEAAGPLAEDQGGEAVAVPPPPDPPGESREERLRAEAKSAKHLMCHYPKNPYCEWCQRGRMTSATVRRKPNPDIIPERPPPTARFEEMSTDTYCVSKSSTDQNKIGGSGEYVCQTNRDTYSGLFWGYPLSSKDHEHLMTTFQHFNPSPPAQGTICKGDNAGEAIRALRRLGWPIDPSLENRWPHNTVHERDTRTYGELLRTNFLASGLHIFPKTWPVSAEYASVSFNVAALPPINQGEHGTDIEVLKRGTTRWELATGAPFPGIQLALGQLVYYRVVSNDKTTAAAVAGIFAGWKFDAGMKYRYITKILSHKALKEKAGEFWKPHHAHESELFVPPGDPIFPLRGVAEHAIANFCDPDPAAMKELNDYPIPWVAVEEGGGIGSRPRKHATITNLRILKHHPTDGCKACYLESGYHSKVCRERFDALYPPKKEALPPIGPEPPDFLPVPAPPGLEVPPQSSSASSGAAPQPDEDPLLPPPSPGYDPSEAGDPGEQQDPEDASQVQGGAAAVGSDGCGCVPPPPPPFRSDSQELAQALQKLRLETDRDRVEAPLPPKATAAVHYPQEIDSSLYEGTLQGSVAAMSAVCQIYSEAMDFWQDLEEGAAHKLASAGQQVVAAIATESAYKGCSASSRKRPDGRKGPGSKTLIEFCCDADSNMGKVGAELGVEVVRLYKEALDLTNPFIVAQVADFIRANPGVSIWGSLPCTAWSSWQHMAIHKYGSKYLNKLQGRRRASLRLFSTFVDLATLVRDGGGEVIFEWPRNSIGWAQGPVSRFISDFELSEGLCDGCAFGMCDGHGHPVLKPWRIVTTSRPLAWNLSQFRCQHPKEFTHTQLEGDLTPKSAFYPPAMCTTALNALFPNTKLQVPAMPVVSRAPDDQQPYACDGGHVQLDQRVDRLPPSLEPAGIVFETDPEAPGYTGPPLHFQNLEDFDLEVDAGDNPQVLAAVTRLLSRADMMSNPAAKEAVWKEAQGLIKEGTWDLTTVTERCDLIADSKRKDVRIHLGQLMSICSEKFAELAEHLRVLKGRIVFRGDIVKDQEGAAAVFQDLTANPTSIAGINNNLAYGMIPGHKTTTADAVKAYVQSMLDSKCATWVQLPPELWPADWRGKYSKPMVLLVKPLYGHPEAGAHWERHLERILIGKMKGTAIPEFPSSYFFPDTGLLLTVYVDDFTLSGPEQHHAGFWKDLRQHVTLDPETPLERVLGRHHDIVSVDGYNCMSFNMQDYALQACELYQRVAGGKPLKFAPTPFLPEGSLTPEDDQVAGELAGDACKVLMKCLWLGRLARPDIIKPIGDLATQVQKWSRNCDKALYRLICYIHSTLEHRLVGTVNDVAGDLRLRLYVDADFAGDRHDAKSTSGGYLVLYGDATFFPLAWICKKQTAVSRSTTEAEVISLAHSLFQEALPTLQLWCKILGRDVCLEVLEDNEATIKIVKKKGSAKLRHVSRTHKVNLASTYEVFEDPSVDIAYVNTKEPVSYTHLRAHET